MVKDKKCTDCEAREAFYRSFEEDIAYTDKIIDGRLIRKFSEDIPAHLLKWHIDDEDRLAIPLSENDWKFQYDNQLPISMNENILVRKGEFHRLIKGTTPLIIEICKL
jgi:hypothetical protein